MKKISIEEFRIKVKELIEVKGTTNQKRRLTNSKKNKENTDIESPQEETSSNS